MYFGLVRLLKWVTGPLEFAGRHPAIFLCLPSAYLLLFYPILWKDIDAVAQLVWPAGAANILHYPPLYCFLGRIPFWIGDAASAALMRQPIPTLNLWATQSPSLAGIYTLIICQHLALIGALVFLTKCSSGSVLGRGIVALCFVLASSLYAQQQCAGSESLSVTAILLTVAFGLHTLEKPRLRYWIGFTLAFFAAIGTRHINVILGASLPLAFLGIGCWRLSHRQPEWRHQLRRGGIAVLCVLIAFAANVALSRVMIATVGDEYRTSMGVTLSDRIETFLNKLPASERKKLADKLASAEPNPTVRVAIRAQVEKGSYSLGGDQVIRDALLASGVPNAKAQAESERVILASDLAYLKTLHPRLVSLIWRDFSNGFIRATNGKLSRSVFISNEGGARLRLQQPQLFRAIASLPAIDYRRAASELARSRRDSYLGLGGRVPLIAIFVIVLALGITLAKRGWHPAVWLAQALLLSSVALFLANCICVYYMDRYTLPLMVCGLTALVIQIGSLADSAQKPRLQCRAAGSAAGTSPNSNASEERQNAARREARPTNDVTGERRR